MTSTTHAVVPAAKDIAGRVLLPSHLVPVRYDLDLVPDLTSFTFTGICKIVMTLDKTKLNADNCKWITLHAKELAFQTCTYSATDDGPEYASDEIHVNVKQHTVKFVFDTHPIPYEDDNTSTMTVKITYTGFLNDQMAGFYRSQYTDICGQKQFMATTQFEALDARRCFPCVDEPAVKAIFTVHLTIPSHLNACSNMPEAAVVSLPPTPSNSGSIKITKKRISYLPTPKMSTYLLAFCVGEFDCVQAQTSKTGVLVRVYTPPGKSHQGQFALSVACQCLEVYNDFFQKPYPLPKLDMIAIPDFAMGAMENWGLVTYREVDLLIDPLLASNQQKQRVATVVTHELAHQWFGNLVTMTWWDDLWLNEGFASWTENYAADAIFPQYQMWDQFVTGAFSSALRLDALRTSHPIQVPIHHAEEVEQVFDAISYSKGASVVRMICAVLGMKNFQAGLVSYMNDYAYGNTETTDLWQAWETASGMPVQDVMASWTEQMGFPLLRVTKETWNDGSGNVTLELSQEWFLADGSTPTEEERAKLWNIPILIATANKPKEPLADMTLMRERTCSITVPLSSSADDASCWIKVNAGQQVPMRVLPSPEMLCRLYAGISNKTLPAVDRAGVLADVYAQVKAGYSTPDVLVKLLNSFSDEDEYIVWVGISDALAGFASIIENMGDDVENAKSAAVVREKYFAFGKKLVLKLQEKVGWQKKSSADGADQEEGHLTSLLRGVLIGLLCRFASDDPTVLQEARTRFAAWQADHDDVTALPADLKTSVFQIVLKNGGVAEYEAIKQYFYTATDNAERKHVLNSIGSIADPKLKRAVMEWTTAEVKLQDFFYAMGSVSRSNAVGRDIAHQFFLENFDLLSNKLKTASASLMNAVIVLCCGSYCSNAKADEIEAFFQAHPCPRNSRSISQMLENMRANAKLVSALEQSPLVQPDFWNELVPVSEGN